MFEVSNKTLTKPYSNFNYFPKNYIENKIKIRCKLKMVQ